MYNIEIDKNGKPIFQSRQNTAYKINIGDRPEDDKTVWHSRSCAVVSHVWVIKDGQFFVLIGKRGSHGDYPGKYNIPCGYFDWNENLRYAMYRELWEETGIFIPQIYATTQYSKIDQPWYVNTSPSENLQNISLHTGIVLDLIKNELPILSLDNMEENESIGAYWMHIDTVLQIPEDEWAFNHYKRLREFILEITPVFNKYK